MMKVISFCTLLVLLTGVFTSKAQQKSKEKVTTSFKVEGVCNMCKERIENAANIKGVKMASWDKESRMLEVVYIPAKVSIDSIYSSVARAGHDTDKKESTPEQYKKLPQCCAYRDGVKTH